MGKLILAVLLPVFLTALPETPTASLEGTVLDSVTGAPVAGARVVLENRVKRSEYHVLTDSQGQFAFHGAAPGKYKLLADKNGYVHVVFGGRRSELDEEGEPLPLAPDEKRSGVELRMIPAAVLAGRIVDNTGEPMPGLFVVAGRMGHEGRGRRLKIAKHSLMVTNDRGEYRLFGLPPGKYYLIAAGLQDFFGLFMRDSQSEVEMGTAPPKEKLGTQYFPGVPDPAQAIILELRAGEEKAGVDFRYDYTPLVSVRGRVTVPAVCPGNVSVHAGPEIRAEQEDSIQFAITADGSFEVRGVSQGSWRISANSQDQKSACSSETVTVQAGASGAGGVALALRPAVELSGVVRMESEPGFRFQKARVYFEMFEADGENHAEIKADGRFNTRLSPENWTFGVIGAAGNAFIKSARLGATDVLESGLNLISGTPGGELEIVLSSAGAQVEGSVSNASGRPARRAIVVLAPEAHLRAHGRLFYRATADEEGRFSLRGIAPGEYKLFAWNDVEGEAYRDPGFLRDDEANGEKVVLGENQVKQAQLKLIVR
ncbi:MAG: carboxypeptidase-like regulatory domain-containing protein [Acidobacteria bacterium]|nr:carboxypeptidase-like regulatory domain-containing protein [Acidobacteriota bacterium]